MVASRVEVTAPVLRTPGTPMSLESLLVDPPRDDEVRVKMVASGVCHSCLHAADGSHVVPLPMVLGDEGAGVVEAVGAGCRFLRPGDHVVISWAPSCGICSQCIRGYPARCQQQPPFGQVDESGTRFRTPDGEEVFHYGPATYSPLVVVKESAAIRISEALPLEIAALLGCSVTTGVGAVTNTANVRPGSSVAVFGCGGVGLNVVQAARMIGAMRIVAVDIVTAKLEIAGVFGATDAVDAGASDPVEAIRDLVPGGIDYSFVAVGATRAIEQGVDVLGPGGTCVVIGAPPHGAMASFNPHAVRAGELRIVGCAYGSANPAFDFPRYAALYSAGLLPLDGLVTRRYSLSEANEAFVNLARGDDARGLIVF